MLLSIIMPTHNRAKYAAITVRSLLALDDDVQVIVSDTSDSNELFEILSCYQSDSRLILHRPGTGLSVVDNFNSALALASGDFISYIGDDDFIIADALKLLKWAKIQSVDAVAITAPAIYYWPDFTHRRRGRHYSGTIHIKPFSGSVKFHNASASLDKAARNLGGGVFQMPRAYAGIVSRELALQIVNNYGRLFGGVSPDIYSSALISFCAKRCVIVDYPIIVSGSSGASTAGKSAQGKHEGGLRDNDHIGLFKELEWSDLIPDFYSVPTVWGFSLYKALQKIGYTKKIGFGRLYAKCLLYFWSYRHHTQHCLQAHARDRGWRAISIELIGGVIAEVMWILGKGFSLLRHYLKMDNTDVIEDLKDTESAGTALEEYILSKSLVLSYPN